LAILEHLMLVLPLDTTALWRWALRKKKGEAAATAFEAHTAPVLAPTLDKHDKLFQIH
jgi:hypothetical protein